MGKPQEGTCPDFKVSNSSSFDGGDDDATNGPIKSRLERTNGPFYVCRTLKTTASSESKVNLMGDFKAIQHQHKHFKQIRLKIIVSHPKFPHTQNLRVYDHKLMN